MNNAFVIKIILSVTAAAKSDANPKFIDAIFYSEALFANAILIAHTFSDQMIRGAASDSWKFVLLWSDDVGALFWTFYLVSIVSAPQLL